MVMGQHQRSQHNVAFLGPVASYTHQAASEFFSSQNYPLVPQQSIEEVFSAVQAGSVYRGVVPFENSTNGSVVFTLDLFADLKQRFPDILVCGEVYIEVHHCLLGYSGSGSGSTSSGLNGSSPRSPSFSRQQHGVQASTSPSSPSRFPPSIDLAKIRKIYSHPQAWGQCKDFLSTNLKGVERHDVGSTSRAAEIVARDPSGTSAAISSGIAARVHGLRILRQGIEDRDDNVTRFFVIRKKDETLSAGRTSAPTSTPAQHLGSPGSAMPWLGGDWMMRGTTAQRAKEEELMAKYKTLIAFTVDHDDPGALADSLAVFKRYRLNLTSINTRPSGVKPWNYIFFVELKGKRLGEEDGGAVNNSLRDLGRVTKSSRWLGSWESKS